MDIKPIDPQLSFLNFKDKTPKAENFTNPVLDMVNECKIDELSPKEALDFLYNLKNIYADNKN